MFDDENKSAVFITNHVFSLPECLTRYFKKAMLELHEKSSPLGNNGNVVLIYLQQKTHVRLPYVKSIS